MNQRRQRHLRAIPAALRLCATKLLKWSLMLHHHELAAAVRDALLAAQADGALPPFDLPEVTVERPR